MFGINDNKAASQDPVMPQPLESPDPGVSNNAVNDTVHDASTAPPLDSDPPAVTIPDYTSPQTTDGLQAAPSQPPYSPPTAPPMAEPARPTSNDSSPDGLLQIKQQALQNLAPLVGRLDQTPEEKFKTTMMMLQASDNPQLVNDAYAAANQITDEKVRAQALLDVVNEINYFTHHDGA